MQSRKTCPECNSDTEVSFTRLINKEVNYCGNCGLRLAEENHKLMQKLMERLGKLEESVEHLRTWQSQDYTRLRDAIGKLTPNFDMNHYEQKLVELKTGVDLTLERMKVLEKNNNDYFYFHDKDNEKIDNITGRIEKLEDNIDLFSMKEANRLIMQFQGRIDKLETKYDDVVKGFMVDHRERIEKLEAKHDHFVCSVCHHCMQEH